MSENRLEPPYGAIASALKCGDVIPFLGAGVNLGGAVASDADPGPGVGRLPSGYDLSRELAQLATFPEKDDRELGDLSKVASYYVEVSGRRNLLRHLHEVFNRDYAPCAIHEYLAEIERPMLIVTTNYDDLTERAFQAKGKPFDLVIHPTDRSDLKAAVLWWRYGEKEAEAQHPNDIPMTDRLRTTTVIYKMHGTVVRPWYKGVEAFDEADRPYLQDNYVITEEDYINFLHRMTEKVAVPMQFMTYFSARQFLFLGYGLRDWNLRVVLKNLQSILNTGAQGDGEDPSWAIQYNPSSLERDLWERRRVKIYNQDINQFVSRLRNYK
jgi:hypothetical protein